MLRLTGLPNSLMRLYIMSLQPKAHQAVLCSLRPHLQIMDILWKLLNNLGG